jgi:hypothetical protein
MDRSQSPVIETPLRMAVGIRWVPDLVAGAESGRASSLDVLNSVGIVDAAA